MSVTEHFPRGSSIVLAAFNGWNDAGDAATDAVDYLLSLWPNEELAEISDESYYDFQETRPIISAEDDGTRRLIWPSTVLYRLDIPTLPDTTVFALRGVEPSLRWRTFASEIFSKFPKHDDLVLISVGALLGDTPHTRPIAVTATTTDSQLARITGFASPKYEGPVGILSVLQEQFAAHNLPCAAIWAAVPHYFAAPPSPKASLALVQAIGNLLGIEISAPDLIGESNVWQQSVESLSNEDPELSAYVSSLETSHDADVEFDGDQIAREFERFLRRSDD